MKIPFQFYRILVGLAVFSYQVSSGQDIKQLKAELNVVEDEKLKVGVLNELAWTYQSSYPDTALLYARKALFLAKNNGWWNELGTSHSRIGSSFYYLGLYDSAIHHHSKSLELRKGYASIELQGNAALNLGISLTLNEEYDEAIKALKSSLDAFTSIKNEHKGIYVKLKLTDLYLESYSLIQAQKAIEEIDTILQSMAAYDGSFQADIAYAKARLFQQRMDFEQALRWSQKSLMLYEVNENNRIPIAKAMMLHGNIHYAMHAFDSCRYYYIKGLYFADGHANNLINFKLHANLMQLWLIEGVLDSARNQLIRADSLAELLPESSQQALFNKYKGDYYLAIGDIEKAALLYEKSLMFPKRTSTIKRMESYFNLYSTYSRLGKHDKSADALWHYGQLRDSLESLNEQIRVYEDQVREKKHENELLLKENERRAAHEKLKDTQLI